MDDACVHVSELMSGILLLVLSPALKAGTVMGARQTTSDHGD